MNNCQIQAFLQNPSSSQNVSKTLFDYHKIDEYFEQHQIFEIIAELMICVSIDRPAKVIDYLSSKLLEISEKYVRDFSRIRFYNSKKDGCQTIKKLSKERRLPLIQCVTQFKIDSIEILRQFDKFLGSNSLRNHHLIICDFKDTDKNDDRYLRVFRKTTRLECPSKKPQNFIKIQSTNFCENFHHILNRIRNMKPEKIIKGNWSCRVMIVGRWGAGRKTQGALLAKRFGLTLFDVDYLIESYEKQPSLSEKHIWGFWGFLQQTLLKLNCLQNGYVIVCSIVAKESLEILVEKFIYGPNRIFFLHTSERECRRRLQSRTYLTEANISNYQFNLYNLHKKEFVECLRGKKFKILHINGNDSVEKIKSQIWSKLESL
jgi:shikimate kinase